MFEFKAKPFIFISVLALILSLLLQFVLPKKYSVQTTLMPISGQTDSTRSRMLASLNIPFGLLDSGGNTDLLTFKELMLSRRILTKVIQQCNAAETISSVREDDPVPVADRAAEKMSKSIELMLTKGQLIRASLTSSLPVETSICLLNQFVPVLNEYMEKTGFNRSQAKRKFLESQILQRRQELDDYAKQLSGFSEESMTVAVDSKILRIIEEYSSSLSQQAMIDLKLQILEKFQPEETDAIEKLKKERDRLSKKLEETKLPSDFSKRDGGVNIPYNKSSILKLYYIQLKDKMAATNEVLALLGQQLELIRIEEVENKSFFEVIDSAITPKGPSSPVFYMNFIMLLVLFFASYFGFIFFRDKVLIKVK